ncbi:hypothetical protein ACFX16_009361 [Malus domestica]
MRILLYYEFEGGASNCLKPIPQNLFDPFDFDFSPSRPNSNQMATADFADVGVLGEVAASSAAPTRRRCNGLATRKFKVNKLMSKQQRVPLSSNLPNFQFMICRSFWVIGFQEAIAFSLLNYEISFVRDLPKANSFRLED